ncbi:hypothetical protein H2200_013178 [Cladophialophora chaetospira]|uniref:Heterokaryon incompatibility domain-containing protein n=1 Tax=Cladophialophora chaetospira TaxID=386627 RepID=A0AA38WWA2_9EURO|nr:hypothetical protein H2200_013178 [Cladophialophora chaetospira]
MFETVVDLAEITDVFFTEIRCTLKAVDLDDSPEYDAISYTWGEDNGAWCMIYINNHPSLIRPNLFRALRRVRSSDEVRTLWIDALSIAQDDLEEKAQQVMMIGRIFRQAACVRAWLGEQTENSLSQTMFRDIQDAVASRAILCSNTLFYLSLLAEVAGVAGIIICGSVRAASAVMPLAILVITLMLFTLFLLWYQPRSRKAVRELSAWRALMERAYWSRLWVIQELVLAQKVILHCGDEIADWDELTEFPYGGNHPKYQRLPTVMERVSYLYERQQSRKEVDPIFRIADLRHHDTADTGEWYQRRKWLFELMYDVRDTACADQRDRVYSLLSVDFEQETEEKHINPDYTKSIPELYVEVLKKRVSEISEDIRPSALAKLALGLSLDPTQMSDILRLLEGDDHHEEVKLSFKTHQNYTGGSDQV